MTEETATNPADGDELLPEAGVETEGLDTDTTDEGEDNGDVTTEPDEEVEEIEHDGRKYALPKALKPALLMQADYTRKTQELAESRRELDAERSQIATAAAEQIQTRARIIILDDQLAQYEKVDWAAYEAYDKEHGTQETSKLFRQFQFLKDERVKALTELQQKDQERAMEAQRSDAKRIQEAVAVLARDIPGWSNELAGKLDDYAEKRFGFTRAEIATYAKGDPRVVKLLHRAFAADQAAAANTTKTTPTKPAAPAARPVTVKPVPPVGARSAPAAKDPERMSTDEWMRYERARMAKKGKGK